MKRTTAIIFALAVIVVFVAAVPAVLALLPASPR